MARFGLSVFFGIVVIISILAFVVRVMRDYRGVLSKEPWLVSGTKNARSQKIIDGRRIMPSSDQKYGTEFTYSFWMYINNWSTKANEWKHVLHKGNASAIPLQSPGIWLYPGTNKLAINMNTFESVKESCNIGNIPINKWVHITVTLMGKYIDVYVNGKLKKRCKLKGVPKLNFGDLYINNWQGFDGFLSRVRYFNYAVPYWKIEQIVAEGPSDAPCVDTGEKPPYLSEDWYQTTGFPETYGFPSTL